ncbi:hypothetical protein L9F63_003743, partial [Diploptera punctata]
LMCGIKLLIILGEYLGAATGPEIGQATRILGTLFFAIAEEEYLALRCLIFDKRVKLMSLLLYAEFDNPLYERYYNQNILLATT